MRVGFKRPVEEAQKQFKTVKNASVAHVPDRDNSEEPGNSRAVASFSSIEKVSYQRKNPGHDLGQDHAQGQDFGGQILGTLTQDLSSRSCFLAPRSWP